MNSFSFPLSTIFPKCFWLSILIRFSLPLKNSYMRDDEIHVHYSRLQRYTLSRKSNCVQWTHNCARLSILTHLKNLPVPRLLSRFRMVLGHIDITKRERLDYHEYDELLLPSGVLFAIPPADSSILLITRSEACNIVSQRNIRRKNTH